MLITEVGTLTQTRIGTCKVSLPDKGSKSLPYGKIPKFYMSIYIHFRYPDANENGKR